MEEVLWDIEAVSVRWAELDVLRRLKAYDELFGRVQALHESLQLAFRRDTRERQALTDFNRAVMPVWSDFERMALADLAAEGDDLPEMYAHWVHQVRLDASLVWSESGALEASLHEATAAYVQICANRSFVLHGKSTVLPTLLNTLLGPERDEREAAFRAWCRGVEETSAEVRSVMVRQVQLRQALAAGGPHSGVEAYSYAKLHRDFRPEETAAFRDVLRRRLGPDLDARRERLGVAVLRPWDWKADSTVFAPVFADQDGALRHMRTILEALDPELAAPFERLVEADAFDLFARPGKAGGACCFSLLPGGLPFVFANTTGCPTDLLTVVHEVGHALHFLATEDQPLLGYRKANLEISEIASIALEGLALEHIDAVVGPEAGAALRRWRANRTSDVFRNAVRVDAFQSWLYAEPEPEEADLDGAWERIGASLDPQTDWSGLEAERGRGWQTIRHLFIQPFYFIEYALASVVAEQIVERYRADPAAGLQTYKGLLTLGGSRGSREVLAAVGLDWPMDSAAKG